MSLTTFKLIHLLGIFALMVALAGMAAHAAAGHTKDENKEHRTLLALHGLGALLALVGGLGLLTRIDIEAVGFFSGWVWAKVVLWVLLGGLVALPYRNQAFARSLFFLLPLLAFLGAFLAVHKPF